uniref:B-like cyclin n=1 Tax=Quercus lobata TaxID=97700 RepID=A0A7N2KWZ2_QUELO
MAANFWTSSHYKQLLDQEDVDVVHPLDKEKGITLEDFKLIKLHMANYIWKLAQNVKVRQRVVATAVTYMRRVYTRKSMTEYDPRLVAPTCLYLASKAEESTVQARLLVFYLKKLYADEKYRYDRYEIKDILEMEMKILEALNYYLVVFHPYRALSQLLQDANLNDISMTQLTWGLLNDTYKMDLILVHAPHLIALACIYIASVLREKDTTAWFEELRVDMNVITNPHAPASRASWHSKELQPDPKNLLSDVHKLNTYPTTLASSIELNGHSPESPLAVDNPFILHSPLSCRHSCSTSALPPNITVLAPKFQFETTSSHCRVPLQFISWN